jgi:hypothetical protein
MPCSLAGRIAIVVSFIVQGIRISTTSYVIKYSDGVVSEHENKFQFRRR